MIEIIIMVSLALILVIFIGYYIRIYNKLNAQKQNVIEGWSGIDVQLKRRHDLIPNLIKVVNEYAKHEKKIFNYVAELRSEALMFGKKDINETSRTEKNLTDTLKSIFVLAESYPVLKANKNFLSLQDELTETEDQIASARRIYNSNVADYNTLIYTFPSNIVAKINRFIPSDFFQKD